MNRFTAGAVAGIVTIGLAIPLLAQVVSAASVKSSTRPAQTQQQVTDMAARDAAFLQNIDALVTLEKSAAQAHETALTAAAGIVDPVQRSAAVKKANDDERAAIQAALTANPALKSAMMPFAFGGPKGATDKKTGGPSTGMNGKGGKRGGWTGSKGTSTSSSTASAQ